VSLAALTLAACAGQPERVDLLVRGGLVYDGTGSPPRIADVGIADGQVRFVKKASRVVAARTIDANGLAVAPGFIDAHSHVPEAVERIEGPFIDAQDLSQGVTTILASPDGGLSPRVMRQLQAALSAKGMGVNYSCYVGHNGIREEAMPGQRRAATPEEIERMAALVREGMEMGCVGLSTGLMYDPGMFATEAEVQALAAAVKPYGGTYDSHTRDPGFHMVESEREAIELGKTVGIPAKLAHLKATGLINKGHIGEVIAMVETARAQGFDIVADQYPFDGATVRAVYDLFVLPDGRGDRQVTEAEVRAALADPARRSAVREATENGVDKGFSWIKAVGYGNVRIVDAPENPDLVDENIELLAKKRGIAPFDLLADLAARNNVRVTLGTIDEADIRELIVKPWVMVASDGAYIDARSLARGYAHPRASGSFTRVLGHYSRDLKLFPLEEAIRKMTGFPATHLGLADRGRLMPGLAADVVLFDPATVAARATYADPGALSTGIITVIVNGKVAFENGKPTGVTAGQFVPRKR
tara:strand:- start:2989 stop:4578 length:1590 start_codon:yes stop_codon:yes gene_type:complete